MTDHIYTSLQNKNESAPTLVAQIPLPLPETTPDSPTAQIEQHNTSVRTVQNNVQSSEYREYTPTAVPMPASAHTGIFRILLQAFFGIMALLALSVYSITLLTEGGMLLSEGIGKIAMKEIFGTMTHISVQAVSPPLTESNPDPVLDEANMPLLPLSSLPANENESVPVPITDIRRHDLSSRAPFGLDLINETPYAPDLETLLTRTPIPSLADLQKEHGSDTPIVLILHTHGTEAFSDSAAEGYHTTDTEKNILSLGSLLADELQNSGIPTLHCSTLFDEDSFDSAYYNAALYIREILAQYPSISYIFDIHRDAITDGDSTGVAPYTEADGVGYAQMMFVVGTDHGGSGHTGWLDNLSLAVRLQTTLHGRIPTLMRNINLRSASFNAQYTKGSLLIEAGAAASDMEEAKNSIRLLAEVIAAEIIAPGKNQPAETTETNNIR